MKIDQSNCYLKEHRSAISICIEIPDTRNYIHCNNLHLDSALAFKQDILNREIGNWNTKIVKDGTYYRVNVLLHAGEQLHGENNLELEFHSRKLNLNDAEFEYFTLISGNTKAENKK